MESLFNMMVLSPTKTSLIHRLVPQLSIAGPWQIEVVVRRKGVEDSSTTFDWTVAVPTQPVRISNQPLTPVLTLAALGLLLLFFGLSLLLWRRREPIGRSIAAWSAALLAAILFVTTAAAHTTTVVKSNPANGAVVAGNLTQVTAQFSEELETKLSRIQVLDASGQHVSEGLGKVDLDDPDHKTMAALLSAPLHDGVYTVQWHVLLTDGDASDGKFQFTVAAGAAGAVAATGSTVAATVLPTALAPLQGAAKPTVSIASPQASTVDSGRQRNVWLIEALGSLVVIGLGVTQLIRWRRRRQAA